MKKKVFPAMPFARTDSDFYIPDDLVVDFVPFSSVAVRDTLAVYLLLVFGVFVVCSQTTLSLSYVNIIHSSVLWTRNDIANSAQFTLFYCDKKISVHCKYTLERYYR